MIVLPGTVRQKRVRPIHQNAKVAAACVPDAWDRNPVIAMASRTQMRYKNMKEPFRHGAERGGVGRDVLAVSALSVSYRTMVTQSRTTLFAWCDKVSHNLKGIQCC